MRGTDTGKEPRCEGLHGDCPDRHHGGDVGDRGDRGDRGDVGAHGVDHQSNPQVERQSSFGCYHPEAAGLLPNDVHVIDLRDKTGKSGKRLKRSVGDVELPEVVVELGPELTEGGFPSHFLIG